MTFTADAEPPDDKRGEEQRFEMDTAGTAGESMIQPSITPGESGGVTTPVTTDPAPPYTEVVVTDAGTNPDIATLSVAMQPDVQNLFSDPTAFIHWTVIKDFGQPHGVCSGVIYDNDEDNHGNSIWGIQWGDGTKENMDINEMRKCCVLSTDEKQPDQPWQAANEYDLGAVRRRLNDLKMAYYVAKNGDTWPTVHVCAALSIEQGHRKLYYAWISKYHGYGSAKHDDIRVPWMKFVDPYSTARPKATTKYQRGVPFPHPHGGEWRCTITSSNACTITSSNADDVNGKATAVECPAQIQLLENMKMRTTKIQTLIDEEKDRIQINNVHSTETPRKNKSGNLLKNKSGSLLKFKREPQTNVTHMNDTQVQQVSHAQMAEYAEAFLCDSDYTERTDAFTTAVIKEISILKMSTTEQLNTLRSCRRLNDETIAREDGPTWKAVVATELAAFDKYDVMEHRVSRADLRNRGIRGRAIPLEVLYEVKKNDDGSYAKHKVRCILMGYSGFLVEGIHYQDTYAPFPDNFSNMFEIKKVDPRYFLGCLMEIVLQSGGSFKLTITQPDFVEDMQLEFGSHLSAEQAKYKEMGVLTLTGKPLWLSQRCYNMLLFGVTQLYSIKSKPSQRMYVECRTTHAALAAR